MIIFVAGFVAKLCGLSAGYQYTWLDVISFWNLDHLIAGAVLVGCGSIFGATFDFFFQTRIPANWMFGNSRGSSSISSTGSSGRDGAKMVLAIVVVIGLLVALHWVYKRIQSYAKVAALHTQNVVLEYHPESDVKRGD